VQSAISVFHRFKNSIGSLLAKLSFQQSRLKQKTGYFFSPYTINTPEYNLWLAFEAFFSKPIYGTHEKHIGEIEALRKKLLQDNTIITRHDFGAGLSKNLYKRKQATSVAKLCKGSSMPKDLARLLYYIVYYTKPKICLELGTCLGISGAYLAQAQKLVVDNGLFVTLEGDPASAAIARKNFRLLHLNNAETEVGRFADTLPGILSKTEAIDFALIDGHHNGPATLEYYQHIKPHLSENAVLVFDDIDWSAGMQKAWQSLTIFPELYICVDLGRTGICIFSSRNLPKRQLSLPL
jgi:predicted O-methyltransferase YrrM